MKSLTAVAVASWARRARGPVAFGEVSRGAFACVRGGFVAWGHVHQIDPPGRRWGGVWRLGRRGCRHDRRAGDGVARRAAGWAVWVSAWPATAARPVWTAATGGGIDDTWAALGTASSGSTSAAGTGTGGFGDGADGCGWVLWGVVGCGRGHNDGAGADGA